MSEQPISAIVDQLIERAALASTGVAVLDVAQLVALRAALRGASVARGIHLKGQAASAKARRDRTRMFVLRAADVVLARNPHIRDDDLVVATQAQLEHQRHETGLPRKVWHLNTIAKHLKNPQANLNDDD